MRAMLMIALVSSALVAAACDDSGGTTAGGGAGAGTSSGSTTGGGTGGAGAGQSGQGCGGCMYVEDCDSDPDECTPSGGCGDECSYSGESWQISASTCTGIPDGYYAWRERTGPAWCDCSGWPICEAAGYKASGPQGSWTWTKIGAVDSEFCPDPVDGCRGLPFSIVDAAHPDPNADCDYQCTSDGPSVPSASCQGPNSETCSFDYLWEQAY